MDRLTGILAFVRAAELRSFANAARALGVTASGVGKSVGRLEAELGVRLLARTTRRVSLTDEGALFFEHCRRILDDLDAAQSLVSGRRAAARGRLRASLPSTLGRRLIVPRLPAFIARHPEVALEVSLADRRVNLIEEQIDVAVRIGALGDSTLVARRIGAQQIVTVAAPKYLGGRPIAALADLTQSRSIVFRMPTTGRDRPWLFAIDGRTVEWRPKPYIAFDDGEALVAAACAGIGVTQVPSYMAEEALARRELVELLVEQRPVPDPISVVYPTQRSLPARTRAFVDFLVTVPGLQGAPASATRRSARRR